MRRRTTVLALWLACTTVLLGGCAAEGMKGTPFFTGEYEGQEGAVEDRVNLWPLLYYREPALSVLWPVGEVAPDRVAVRPLVSVHKLDEERPEVNILWPLSSLDFDEREYHVFPAFWKTAEGALKRFAVFPLFWYSKQDYFALFPLYLRCLRPGGRSVHVLWPVFNRKTGEGKTGWRVWPLLGHYAGEAERETYALWPFVRFARSGETARRRVFPFYFARRSPESAWDLLLPFFYRYSSDDVSRLALAPLFYRSSDADGHGTFLSPVYMGGRTKDSHWDAVPPFWYARESGEERSSMVFPLYYRWRGRDGTALVTLPGGYSRSGDKTVYSALPLLSFYSASPEERDLWAPFPLTRFLWRGGLESAHVFPLFGWDRSEGRFTSLPVGWRSKGNQPHLHLLLGLLGGWKRTDDARHAWLLGPLVKARWSEDERNHHVWPLYSWQHDENTKRLQLGPFLSDASLVGALWRERSQNHWLFPVFHSKSVSAMKWAEGDQTFKGDRYNRSSTIFPFLFYWNRRPLPDTVTLVEQEEKESVREGRPEPRRGLGLFPLFWYTREGRPDAREGTEGKQTFSLLVRLFDHLREVRESDEAEGEMERYRRWRVLWRLVHYERLDDAASLDVFPGITWDKSPDRTSVSFLWRLFRYERSEEGTRVHLLFIPFGGSDGG